MTTDKRDPLPCEAQPDLWFSESFEGKRQAKTICTQQCPIALACQDYALREGIPCGVFGGLDGRDRLRIWHGWIGGRPSNFQKDIERAVSHRASLDERKVS